MFELNVTPEALLAFIVATLSLVFDYLPGLAEKFDALDVSKKRIIMVGLSVLAAVVVFWGQCTGWVVSNLVCDLKSAVDLIYGIVLAVAINYGFHKATKPNN